MWYRIIEVLRLLRYYAYFDGRATRCWILMATRIVINVANHWQHTLCASVILYTYCVRTLICNNRLKYFTHVFLWTADLYAYDWLAIFARFALDQFKTRAR